MEEEQYPAGAATLDCKLEHYPYVPDYSSRALPRSNPWKRASSDNHPLRLVAQVPGESPAVPATLTCRPADGQA